MMRNALLLALCLTLAPIAARAQSKSMRTVGYASYYSDKLHGRRTASGEKYHRDSLTCAHLRFPLGTILRVRNTRNGREIDVKVNDRGPYSKRFIVDLSRRAAQELGIIGAPFTEVVLTPVGDIHVPFRVTEREAEHATDSLLINDDINNTYLEQ